MIQDPSPFFFFLEFIYPSIQGQGLVLTLHSKLSIRPKAYVCTWVKTTKNRSQFRNILIKCNAEKWLLSASSLSGSKISSGSF